MLIRENFGLNNEKIASLTFSEKINRVLNSQFWSLKTWDHQCTRSP